MMELPPAIPGWQPPVRTIYPKPIVRVLSALVTIMAGFASTFTGIIALTMFFAIIGSTNYEGGATGIVLFAAFAATPLIAMSHLLVTIGATPLRIARLIWVATHAFMFRSSGWPSFLVRSMDTPSPTALVHGLH